MASTTAKLLGSPPEPFDGKGDKAIAFWNTLENYFNVNSGIFNTDDKKISSALTYFKAGTQAGEWASDRMAIALAKNPVSYGNWAHFKDAFKEQFVPPQTQIEAIQKMHSLHQRNREFNEWYQEWSQYARRTGVDEITKMFAFRNALNAALANKLLTVSPQPTTLPTLVEKAREFDRNWRIFNKGPTNTGQGRRTNIREISGEEPDINRTQGNKRPPFKRRGKLTPQERKHRMDHNLCLYCGKEGHKALECPVPSKRPGKPRPNPSVRQLDTIADDAMEKLSLGEDSGVNLASANYFEPLVDMNIDDGTNVPSFA